MKRAERVLSVYMYLVVCVWAIPRLRLRRGSCFYSKLGRGQRDSFIFEFLDQWTEYPVEGYCPVN